MNKIFFLVPLVFISALLFGQDKNNSVLIDTDFQERRGLSIDFGLAYGFAQDARFSTLQFGGAGIAFGIGHVKQTSDRERRFGLDIGSASMNAGPDDLASLDQLRIALAYEQQRPIGEFFGAQWLAGGELRGGGAIYTSGAEGNNSSRVFTNLSFTALSSLRFTVKDNQLTVGVGLGLLHWAQDGHSFAFSYPQQVLEDGNFSYEDDQAGTPLGQRQLTTLFGLGQFRTNVSYRPGKRLGFNYDWELTRYTQTKGYPVTQGEHRFTVSYTF